IKAYDLGFPFDGKEVEAVAKAALGKSIRGSQRSRAGIAGAVQGAANGAGFPADVFHDVNLTASGPTDGGDIVAEKPESRPNAAAGGDLDASFEAAVFLSEESPRGEAPGSEMTANAVAASELFLESFNDQIAAFEMDVLGPRSVGFQLVVSPAVAASL